MNTTCPRCNIDALSMSVQAIVSVNSDGVVIGCHYDTDSFLVLKCQSCHLTLGGETGDGRLRRANLYNSDEDWGNDLAPTVMPEWERQMHDIAAHLIKVGQVGK